MRSILRHKGFLFLLGALVAAAMLIWIPIIGRYSLEDPLPVVAYAANINEDPGAFLGRRVRLEGDIERVFSPRAFLLEQDTAAGSSLLVIGNEPWRLLDGTPGADVLVLGDQLEVMGRVRRFDLDEFREGAGAHPSDTLLARWDGRPVLLALDLKLTPDAPDMFPQGTPGPGQRGLGGATAPRETGMDEADTPPDVRPDTALPVPADTASGNPSGLP